MKKKKALFIVILAALAVATNISFGMKRPKHLQHHQKFRLIREAQVEKSGLACDFICFRGRFCASYNGESFFVYEKGKEFFRHAYAVDVLQHVGLSLSKNGEVLAFSDKKTVSVYNVKKKERIRQYEIACRVISLSSDGRFLAAWGGNELVFVLDIKDNRLIGKVHVFIGSASCFDLCCSKDGCFLGLCKDRNVVVYDIRDGNVVFYDGKGFDRAQFSEDGDKLILVNLEGRKKEYKTSSDFFLFQKLYALRNKKSKVYKANFCKTETFSDFDIHNENNGIIHMNEKESVLKKRKRVLREKMVDGEGQKKEKAKIGPSDCIKGR